MKFLLILIMHFFIAATAFADIGGTAYAVRCSGYNQINIKIGIDIEFDKANRVVDSTFFYGDSTGPFDFYNDLIAPTSTVQFDNKNNLQNFNVVSYSDAQKKYIYLFIIYIKDAPAASFLRIGSGEDNQAVRDINCIKYKN